MSLRILTSGKCPDCVYELVINGNTPRCLKCIKRIDDSHFAPTRNLKTNKLVEKETLNKFYEDLVIWSKGEVK